jgi:hypothetical protein
LAAAAGGEKINAAATARAMVRTLVSIHLSFAGLVRPSVTFGWRKTGAVSKGRIPRRISTCRDSHSKGEIARLRRVSRGGAPVVS